MASPTSQVHLRPMTEPLHIYLNDHLAGATGGLELFRRAASAAPQERRAELDLLRHEVAEDRAALLDAMAALDVPVRQYKVAAGWLAEKVGRVKPNGHLLSRSPLSNLLELEALVLGVHAKAACWRALRVVADRDDRLDPARLDELLTRAETQAATLETMRQEAAEAVFA